MSRTTISLLLGALAVLPSVHAQARCQWSPLRNAADLFREGQTAGELDPSFTFAPSFKYFENGVPGGPKSGVLARPLSIDYDQTLIDQENCAIYTEFVATTSPGYVIGAQVHFDFRPSDGTSLDAIRVDLVAATTGDWQFNASRTLGHVKGENWDAISQTERNGRDELKRVADAYLDWLLGGGNDTVPWGLPCSALEGSEYSAESCSEAAAARNGTVVGTERSYVIDDTVGGVNVVFESAEGLESYMFRVLMGKLRYVHHHVAAKKTA